MRYWAGQVHEHQDQAKNVQVPIPNLGLERVHQRIPREIAREVKAPILMRWVTWARWPQTAKTFRRQPKSLPPAFPHRFAIGFHCRFSQTAKACIVFGMEHTKQRQYNKHSIHGSAHSWAALRQGHYSCGLRVHLGHAGCSCALGTFESMGHSQWAMNPSYACLEHVGAQSRALLKPA